jgi:hypothetical protein
VSGGRRLVASIVLTAAVSGCGGDDGTNPVEKRDDKGVPTMTPLGLGEVTTRYVAELWTRNGTAYTTTWGRMGQVVGNAVHIWDVTGSVPRLVDSLIVDGATTLGDVQVSDDGSLLVVPTEFIPGSIIVYDITDPRRPVQLSRFSGGGTGFGVHTAEVARVNGKLYAFLCNDGSSTVLGRMTIVDLSNPRAPVQVLSKVVGEPYTHDVFVRDGLLFTAGWNVGMTIWDIGGGGKGGSVSNPIQMGNIRTIPWSTLAGGPGVHNVYWFHDQVTGSKRYAFIGEEANNSLFSFTSGDVHVVDVTDMAAPREVAFYRADGAGTHNFSVDEQNGILYAAYYNGGIRAFDVRGDLSTCSADQKASDGRCDLRKMGRVLAKALTPASPPTFIWGVRYENGDLYASDMLRGLWKFKALTR